MLPMIYVIVYGCAMTASTLAWLGGRLKTRQHSAVMTCLNGLTTILSIAWGWSGIVPSIHATATALWAYIWWHSGGGDDTKRHLRRWARRFQGVRRTAPSHA